ncbi:tRNA pseudouridine(13) synthase TruD [Halosegnis longus]|uniref:Probable tRNA pseudouridine synthase D n=1 Tax=Halosegnis longus TaxID=2216012 RepID=A0AAJ4R768_9EURY|nr:tRNA pseudouridine(13) synthase TruD [Halosegnis longus]RNJ25803.1 tRNA pseudouridine(13) synthase TruD [Salella cibi]
MKQAHRHERPTGVEWYVSDTDGTGGHLRDSADAFRVRELEAVEPEPLDADPGSYAHVVFRATLREWDTNAFAGALASKLGVSRERVSWAGTKDKYAVTTQLFSVRLDDERDLPELDGADIEPLGRVGRPVLFGDLAGNEFEISVAEADHPERASDITAELRAFAGDDERVGVPNYFGPQRFGSARPVTHRVGLAILRGEWEAAVRTYVTFTSETDPEESAKARRAVDDRWGGDWGELTELLPGRLNYERSLLQGLAETGGDDPEDFRAALERFPSNLQQLLVHAAQSYLFNRIVSTRLERGLPFDGAVAGDVVAFADRDAPLPVPDMDRLQRVDENRVTTVNRHVERGRAFVTAPLVGTETDLAGGEPGDIEREILADEGVEPSDFDLPGEFHSEGTRRAVLVTTDLTVTEPLTFQFQLPKGSYATTLLREYLKVAPDQLG